MRPEGSKYLKFLTTDMFLHLFQDLSSEERFHVELHFSPGAKGCEEDKNLPSGYGYRPASREVMTWDIQCIAAQIFMLCPQAFPLLCKSFPYQLVGKKGLPFKSVI